MNIKSIKYGVIVLDVGGTKVTAGILASDANARLIRKNEAVLILAHKTISTYVGGISVLYDEICDLIKDVEFRATELGVKIIKVVGVSHAGKFKKDGTIDFGDSGWDGVNPANELSKRIDYYKFFIINDALAQMHGSIEILLSNPDVENKLVNRKVCYIGPGTGLGGAFMEIGHINERRFLNNDGHIVDIVMQEEPYKISFTIDDEIFNITISESRPTAVKLISGRSIRLIMFNIDKNLLERGKQPVFLPFVSGFMSMSIKEQLDLLSTDTDDSPLDAKLLNLSILEHNNIDNSYIQRALPVAKRIARIQGENLGRLIEKIFKGKIEKGLCRVPQTNENIGSILKRIQWTQDQINKVKGISTYVIGGSIGNKGELSRIILKDANLYLKKKLTKKIELIQNPSDTDETALVGVGLLLNEALENKTPMEIFVKNTS